MDLVKGDAKKLFGRFLFASFGSALISSLYSVVDMVAAGQYHGSSGSAAMALVAPIWNIIYSLGLFIGMGGAVLLSKAWGEKKENPNQFFTISLILTIIFSLIAWGSLLLFEEPILRLFGASDALLPLAKSYLVTVRYTVPIFIINQVLAAFLRNDGDPGLATGAIIFGGLFNVAGDYFFVFTLNMGIEGAGLATVICNAVSLLVMLTHFLKKKNTLRLCRFTQPFAKACSIMANGFPSFFTDAAMGILTIVFNNQIAVYYDDDYLAVYGAIININTFVQCCAYGVGQAVQPLVSTNYASKQGGRVKKFLSYSLITIAVITVIWYVSVTAVPNGFINLFMKANDHVLAIAPTILRIYAIGFIFLPFNVFSTYYFQAILKPKSSFLISACRGLFISVPLLFLLPLASPVMMFWALPITEVLVFVYSSIALARTLKSLPVASQKSLPIIQKKM